MEPTLVGGSRIKLFVVNPKTVHLVAKACLRFPFQAASDKLTFCTGFDFSLSSSNKSKCSTRWSDPLEVAHCLLQKPAWVLLDESMAHMSSANRVKMYQLLTDELLGLSWLVVVTLQPVAEGMFA